MKKWYLGLTALVLVLAIAFGAFVWISHERVDGSSVPVPAAGVAGTALSAQTWEWYAPVAGGLLYKHFLGGDGGVTQLGELAEDAFSLALPEGFETTLVLSRNGAQTYNGSAANFSAELARQPGSYALALECAREKLGGQGYGSFFYTAQFTVAPPPPPPPPPPPAQPTLAVGAAALRQGDVFSMLLTGIENGVTPAAETDLGAAVFLPMGDGGWYCAVPVGNTRAVGDYPVRVSAGESVWEHTVSVLPFEFVEQNLIIDQTTPEITEANSAEAYAQYNQKIPPLFSTWDDERYWDGVFIRPVEGGWISTEFGTVRYTNGDRSTQRSHWGMDFAVGEGTPVAAPNNGRVVLAEYLLNTGWTLVIEHGGGLKSYYYHLSEINVQPDAMVRTGEEIGKVGSTGYSTGAHLHFETRIGNQAISPVMLMDEAGGLYGALA